MFEYLKIPDIILSMFLHKNWTGLIFLPPTVFVQLVCVRDVAGGGEEVAEGLSTFTSLRGSFRFFFP